MESCSVKIGNIDRRGLRKYFQKTELGSLFYEHYYPMLQVMRSMYMFDCKSMKDVRKIEPKDWISEDGFGEQSYDDLVCFVQTCLPDVEKKYLLGINPQNQSPCDFSEPAEPEWGQKAFAGGADHGMDLRDWFAGMALQGELASQGVEEGDCWPGNYSNKLADLSFKRADAMMVAREKKIGS